MPELNEYEYLETAPEYLAPIVDLINWATNERWPKKTGEPATTYAVFLDITGISTDSYGEELTHGYTIERGYLEMSYLAAALELYSNRPLDVQDFISEYERLAMETA